MDKHDAELLAFKLMDQWTCEGWEFKWSNGVRQLGAVAIKRDRKSGRVLGKELRLSRHLVALNSKAEVRETILHEIAHIKAGLENQHNEIWKSWCRTVGAKPQRLADESVRLPAPKYTIHCRTCQLLIGTWYRLPRGGITCFKCGPVNSPDSIMIEIRE